MSDPHPTDRLMAQHYARIRDELSAFANGYSALYAQAYASEDDRFGTFAVGLRSILLRHYEQMHAEIADLADDAHSLTLDYEAHADGTYVSLSPSVLL